MALQWINGRIARKHVWHDGLFTLFIDCPGVSPFACGQFLQVGLPLEDKHLHRPYSVASPHSPTLEFFIVRVDDGELTPRLWGMRDGDPIDVSIKATGGFTLEHTPVAKCIWLLGTGTGLAPYIAMLREKKIWETYEKIIVVHGVRYPTDLAYTEELESYEREHSGRFKTIPVVSRAEHSRGVTGRITTAMENGKLEEMAGERLAPETSAVMMCGNPQMLDDVEAMLNARGMRKHKRSEAGHYVVERYW
ncbi:MAG: ferredoxin--NADP reductase [Planctomycetota bacterium]|jgi:ferredoxin--NADP+ reductase